MPKETNKEIALTALLNAPSVAGAAKNCSWSEATLRRFLRDERFKKEFREARRALFEENMGELQTLHPSAIEAVKRNLNCENASVEVCAAQIIFDQTRKDFETFDILDRLEDLENEHSKQTEKN